MVRYRVYPTLLERFAWYSRGAMNANGELYVSEQDLLDSINRVPKATTVPQQKGVNFENALLTGEGEEEFPAEILSQMRRSLPARFQSQVYLTVKIHQVELYGFVDMLGMNRAIDIKTTRAYQPDKFSLSAQNLYLLALQKRGIFQLDYLITDFTDVYTESYHTESYDFQPLIDSLMAFTDFLEEHRGEITDKKIFR